MDAEEQNQITRDIASHCGNNTEAANIALKLLASPTKVHIWDEKDINNGNNQKHVDKIFLFISLISLIQIGVKGKKWKI